MAGGVAAPSAKSALYENPAGLGKVDGWWLDAQGFALGSRFNPLGMGAATWLGNGSIGGATGVSRWDGTYQWDAGVGLKTGPVAFGLAGTVPLAEGFSSLSLTVGNQIYFSKRVQTGFLFQFMSRAFAAGLGYQLVPEWLLTAVDLAYAPGNSGVRVRPGLALDVLGLLQLEAAYGWDFGLTAAGSPLRAGLGMGLCFVPTRRIRMEVFYNRIAPYYAAFSFHFQ